MRKLSLVGLVAVALCLAPAGASAQDTIQGKTLGCITAGEHPVFSATTSGQPAGMQLWFSPSNSSEWYYVEAQLIGGEWVAKIPKPQNPPIESISYYFMAEGEQTPEATSSVSDSCAEEPVAAAPPGNVAVFTAGGSPLVGALAGMGGVAGAAGGIGATTLVLVGAGVAAGSVGIYQVTKDDCTQ